MLRQIISPAWAWEVSKWGQRSMVMVSSERSIVRKWLNVEWWLVGGMMVVPISREVFERIQVCEVMVNVRT